MPPQMPPSSMGMGGGMPPDLPPGPMMSGGNPYGPSGPPPPGLSSQLPHGHPRGVMYPGGMPMPKPTNPMNTIQLQQLSAQIRSYRLLARNMTPPETLLSIAHGRKPTPAMIARAQAHMQQFARVGMGLPPSSMQTSQAPPYSQAHAQEPPPSTSASSSSQTPPSSSGEPQNTGSINLYPPSPSVSQGQSPGGAQSRTTSSPALAQTATTAAPNVTLPPGGELPLAVKQVVAAAAASEGRLTPSQQPPMAPASQSATSSLGASHQKQHPPQPVKPLHPALKHMKLTPIGKPPGVEPTVIAQERERRYCW